MPTLSVFNHFVTHGAALGYAVSAWLLFRSALPSARSEKAWALPLVIGALAAICHTTGLILGFVQFKGVSGSFFDAFSLTALIIVLITISSQLTRGVPSILIPVFLISGVITLLSPYLGHFHPITTPSPGILLHIISSISAYVLLCLAALQAILLSISERSLKQKKITSGSIVSPLQSTENLLFRLILVGWLILTVAIVSGLIFIDNLFAQHLLHKSVFSIASWLLFTALLIGHWLRGWRGTRAAAWTLGAFTFLVLAYFGSKFVLDIVLHRL